MSEKQLDVENDKCCFFVPIVLGMKLLTGVMILSNVFALIKGFVMFGWAIPVWIKVLVGLDFVVIGGLCFLLGRWFINDNKAGRESLCKGLMINIVQTAVQGLLVILGFATFVYADEIYAKLTPEQQAAFKEDPALKEQWDQQAKLAKEAVK